MVVRRALISGAAALAVLPRHAHADAFTSTAPGLGKRDIREKLTSPLLSAPGRQFPIPTGFADMTTQNTLNTRAVFFAPATTSISDIVLACGGFGNGLTGEVDLPTVGAFTVTAAIEYPAGTFTPVYTNGSRTLSVTPGRTFYQFDPCPIIIPAGAAFFVKCFVSWTTGHFWIGENAANEIPAGWCNIGIGLADNTLTATVFSQTTQGGYCPIVYARYGTPTPVLGIIGDSISVAGTQNADPVACARFIERAMLNKVPVLNQARTGAGFITMLTRLDGYHATNRDHITHLILSMCRNDLQGGTAASVEANMQLCLAPFLARGVQVWCVTSLPTTTSTDAWATTANQTVANAGIEAQRLLYNAWLRTNWQSLGLSGIFDWARVVDPTDSGKWNVDGTAGTRGEGFATISGGAVASVAVGAYYFALNSGGSGYPISSTIPCVVRPSPGDPGTGAAVNAVVNGSGVITSFTVTAGGSGYLVAPMVAPQGQWTNEGVHPTPRGYNEIVFNTGLSPAMFVL